MTPIISIIGNKGGTGKTTLSHMLCQGFGLLGQHSACILTDQARQPLRPEGRRYITADARSEQALGKVIEKLRSLDNWVGVVDGGGNRPTMDERLYQISDIVLLPFRDSHEDIRTVIQDLRKFPTAYAIPSQWPTNPWQLEAAERSTAKLMAEFHGRIMPPINALSSSKLLLHNTLPVTLPTLLHNSARRFAEELLEIIEVLQNPTACHNTEDHIENFSFI